MERIRPSLTLTYGLNYGWQTPPKEKLGRQSVQVNGADLSLQTARDYLRRREESARNGQIYNPPIAFLPVNDAKRNVFDIDWNNIGYRAAVSWNPSFGSGLFGKLFGERKTVIRGGYGLLYDRLNTIQGVVIPTLGVAFAQTINVTAPLCTVSGAAGPSCNATNSNPALSVYRVGVDGKIPLPTVPTLSVPVSPYWGIRPGATAPFNLTRDTSLFPEILSFQLDPKIKAGENHAINLTWQRELPQNLLLEVGYIGRYANKLPQSASFGQVPYMFKDPASGQTFAQAFDTVARELRATPNAVVAPQPWFDGV